MITVTTTPSVINHATPMTEGVVNPASAGAVIAPNADFSNALNAQLAATTNVAAAPVIDEAALLAAQTALLAATANAESPENLTSKSSAATANLVLPQTDVATPVLAVQQPATNNLVLPQTTVTTLTAQQPTLVESAAIKSVSLPNSTPKLGMTSDDTEILLNVTDTLKFIATGAKLGDTLPEGQVIRLQNSNTSTPLTQQTVQAAVQQSVNTPAAVLAKQVTPVQTGEVLSNPQNQLQQAETVFLNPPNNEVAAETPVVAMVTPVQTQTVQTEKSVVSVQTQTVQTEKPVVATATPVQTQTVQTEKPVVATVTPVQTQTVQTEKPVVATVTPVQTQTVQTEKPVVAMVTPVQTQTVQTEKPVVATVTPVQTQTVQTEKSVVATVTPVQTQTVQTEKLVVNATPAQAQTVQTEKPVVNVTPVQAQTVQTEKPVVNVTPVQAQTVQAEKPVVATVTPVQTQQTVQTEKPVVSVQTQAVQAEKPVVATVTTVQTQQTVQTEKPVVSVQAETPVVATVTPVQIEKPVIETVTRSISGEIPVQQVVQNETQTKNTRLTDQLQKEDSSVENEAALSAQVAPTFAQNEIVKNDPAMTGEATTEKPSNDKPQVAENTQPEDRVLENALPVISTQVAPIQVETDVTNFEPTSTQTEEKPALTPAKNLLADVIANRNSGSDMANNSGDKKGNDTAANSAALPTDSAAKNGLDNKPLDTKSFASLLSAEKLETANTTTSATTNDKATPQVAAAAVNKLAQDMKADVPTLTRPLSHPNWSQDVGERIIWMNNRGISSAEIRMNPQNMGPITVRINVDSDQQTSVSFTAQNADVRVALEASIPRLREMLSSQNLNLADVNVSQQSSTSADSSGSQRQNAQMAADASANGQGNRQSNQEIDANGNPVRQSGANGEEIPVDEFANGQVIEGNGTNGLLSIFA